MARIPLFQNGTKIYIRHPIYGMADATVKGTEYTRQTGWMVRLDVEIFADDGYTVVKRFEMPINEKFLRKIQFGQNSVLSGA